MHTRNAVVLCGAAYLAIAGARWYGKAERTARTATKKNITAGERGGLYAKYCQRPITALLSVHYFRNIFKFAVLHYEMTLRT